MTLLLPGSARAASVSGFASASRRIVDRPGAGMPSSRRPPSARLERHPGASITRHRCADAWCRPSKTTQLVRRGAHQAMPCHEAGLVGQHQDREWNPRPCLDMVEEADAEGRRLSPGGGHHRRWPAAALAGGGAGRTRRRPGSRPRAWTRRPRSRRWRGATACTRASCLPGGSGSRHRRRVMLPRSCRWW